MVVVIIILSIALVGFIAATIVFSKKIKKIQWKNAHLADENKILKKSYDDLSSEKEKTFENRIIDLTKRIEEKEDELLKATVKMDEYENNLNSAAIALYSLNSKYQDTVIEYQGIVQSRDDVLALKNSWEEALEALKPQIKELQEELNELKERKRLSILNQERFEEGLYELLINDKEQELISILNRIKLDYPDLKIDLSTIEWKKIWLPKLQDVCNRNSLSCKGIYRLILKENENICYVGQAVNIQDRWYQHVKKMIGVDIKGNEKLYNYRPEDFYWSVLETNPKDINAAEHYWIEFYGCKEVGLNKKA